MTFQPVDATQYIPQKQPFVMVDKLLFADDLIAETCFEIREDNILVNDGFYSTSGLIETIAQTAAAATGYSYKKQNKEVPVGYIGAVQNLKVTKWPPVHSTIHVELKLVTKVMQVSLVSGIVKLNQEPIAGCEMKIFVNANA